MNSLNDGFELDQSPEGSLAAAFANEIRQTAISWTQCKLTLQTSQDEFGAELATITGVPI